MHITPWQKGDGADEGGHAYSQSVWKRVTPVSEGEGYQEGGRILCGKKSNEARTQSAGWARSVIEYGGASYHSKTAEHMHCGIAREGFYWHAGSQNPWRPFVTPWI